MKPDGTPSVCVPHPTLGRCVPPYPTTRLVNEGGPHDHPAAVTTVDGGKMDGFIEAAAARLCVRKPSDPSCAGFVGPAGSARPDVVPRRPHDPQLLGVRRELRPAGPDVRADRLVDASRAPVSSSRGGRRGAPTRTTRSRAAPTCRWATCSTDLKWYEHPELWAWTDITWLLHEAGVSWAYYAGDVLCRRPRGHAGGMRRSAVRPGPRTCSRGSPTCARRGSSTGSRRTTRSSRRSPTGASPRSRGSCPAAAGRASIRAPAHRSPRGRRTSRRS